MSCRRSLVVALAAVTLSTAACSAATDDDGTDTSGSAVVVSHLDVGEVNAAIAKLTSLRTGDTFGSYYEDGVRVEGCWRNPAGNKLSDLKKAFYCSMPLEFRLCNSVVVLTTEDVDVDERYEKYLGCQKKVDAVFGNKGSFIFDDDVNALYKSLFLMSGTLTAEDNASVVAANKPAFSNHSFATLVLSIGKSLAVEAVDMAVSGLTSMVTDYKNASGDEPR